MRLGRLSRAGHLDGQNWRKECAVGQAYCDRQDRRRPVVDYCRVHRSKNSYLAFDAMKAIRPGRPLP